MIRTLMIASAALALAACGDGGAADEANNAASAEAAANLTEVMPNELARDDQSDSNLANAAEAATAPAAAAPKAEPKAAPRVEPKAAPKAERPRPVERDKAAPRPAPTPEPAPQPKSDCTPEHRALGHC